MFERARRLQWSVLAAVVAVGLSGCQQAAGVDEAAAVNDAPVPVQTLRVQASPHPITADLPGRLAPVRIAEVRARVPGIVLERLFEEGSDVKAGDILFRIDPAPYRAALAHAEGDLARAEAAVFQAGAQIRRYQPLLEREAISPQDYDNALAAQKSADASRLSAAAGVDTARLNLEYATVRAPISGRIGRALVSEGSLVGQGEATPMAKIHQLDPIYADFTQPVADVIRMRAALAGGELSRSNGESARVSITLEGTGYTQDGRLLFADVAVDPTTGQVSLRGEFANPDGILLPGMFVRVKTELAVDPQAVFIPQRAVQRGPDGGAQVLLADEDNIAQLRDITTGRMDGANWQVLTGLSNGDRVIVAGAEKVEPGMQIVSDN